MKKTIQWYEKKGRGSYFDPKLRSFKQARMHGYDLEMRFASLYSPKPELKRKDSLMKRFVIKIQKFFINVSFDIIEWTLKQDLPKEKRSEIFDKLNEIKNNLK